MKKVYILNPRVGLRARVSTLKSCIFMKDAIKFIRKLKMKIS